MEQLGFHPIVFRKKTGPNRATGANPTRLAAGTPAIADETAAAILAFYTVTRNGLAKIVGNEAPCRYLTTCLRHEQYGYIEEDTPVRSELARTAIEEAMQVADGEISDGDEVQALLAISERVVTEVMVQSPPGAEVVVELSEVLATMKKILPPRQNRILLRTLEDMSDREIAALEGVAETSVRGLRCRARKKLRHLRGQKKI